MEIPSEIARKFRVERPVGRGGMGVVYRAIQKDLGRPVALKLLVPELASNPVFRARFLDEARLAARVIHPNLVPLYDFDVLVDGTAYIAYALIEGINLGDLIIDRHLGADQSTHIARDVCAALGALHEAGIVHRDVKPQNVIVDDAGTAHVIDLGIARDLADLHHRTRTGEVLGTPHYLSPEQLRGEALTPAADVYATGGLIYALVTGHAPFGMLPPLGAIRASLERMPDPPVRLAADADPFLADLAMRALAREATSRPTMASLLEALETALAHAGRIQADCAGPSNGAARPRLPGVVEGPTRRVAEAPPPRVKDAPPILRAGQGKPGSRISGGGSAARPGETLVVEPPARTIVVGADPSQAKAHTGRPRVAIAGVVATLALGIAIVVWHRPRAGTLTRPGPLAVGPTPSTLASEGPVPAYVRPGPSGTVLADLRARLNAIANLALGDASAQGKVGALAGEIVRTLRDYTDASRRRRLWGWEGQQGGLVQIMRDLRETPRTRALNVEESPVAAYLADARQEVLEKNDPLFWLARAIWRARPFAHSRPFSAVANDLPVRRVVLSDLYQAYIRALCGHDAAALVEIAANLDCLDPDTAGGAAHKTPTWDLWRLQIMHTALDRLSAGTASSIPLFPRVAMAVAMARLQRRVGLAAAASGDLVVARSVVAKLLDRGMIDTWTRAIGAEEAEVERLAARQRNEQEAPLPEPQLERAFHASGSSMDGPTGQAIAELTALCKNGADRNPADWLASLDQTIIDLVTAIEPTRRGQSAGLVIRALDDWLTRIEDRFCLRPEFWSTRCYWDKHMAFYERRREHALRALESFRVGPWGTGPNRRNALQEGLRLITQVFDQKPRTEFVERDDSYVSSFLLDKPIVSNLADHEVWLPSAALGLESADWTGDAVPPGSTADGIMEWRARIAVRTAVNFDRAGMTDLAALTFHAARRAYDAWLPCRRETSGDFATEVAELQNLKMRYGPHGAAEATAR